MDMDQEAGSGANRRGRPVKVAKLIAEYELDGLGDELETRWTRENDRHSLRDLATYFNQQLLASALGEANVPTLDGEVENLYHLLTGDDVNSAEQTRARRRLERKGVDVDALETNFVTYQAIRTYLTNYRDVEYDRDHPDPVERETKNIQQLRGRTVSVVESKLEQLAGQEELSIGPVQTVIDIQVYCESCNTQFEVVDLLEQGGCGCETDG